MNQTVIFGVAAVPAIVGLVQAAKELGLADRAAPAAAILLGILAGLAQTYGAHTPAISSAVAGIGLGLAAAGLYHGTKTTIAPKKKRAPSSVRPVTRTRRRHLTAPRPPQDPT